MSEYINMESRNWNYAGDKGTWARRNDDGTITVKLAAKGTVSRAYCEELREFCAQYGQDFDSIRCGESITFPAVVEAAEEKQGEQPMTATNSAFAAEIVANNLPPVDAPASQNAEVARCIFNLFKHIDLGFYDDSGVFFYDFESCRPDQEYHYGLAGNPERLILRADGREIEVQDGLYEALYKHGTGHGFGE